MITNPEIICDLFSFLDKDQIERIQLVNHLWNNVIIRHKNILPLRHFRRLYFSSYRIGLYDAKKEYCYYHESYIIEFDGTNLSKVEHMRKRKYDGSYTCRYPQLTVDEVLKNLNGVVFDSIGVIYHDKDPDYLLNLIKLITTKTGGRFRGKFGYCYSEKFDSKLIEIFDNYIIVDDFSLRTESDSYIREVCANPEILQLPLTPKRIRLQYLEFKKNDKVLNFTCNGKLNGANRVTIYAESCINYKNFIRQWFERLHRYTDQYLIRRCVLHETDSYTLVIEMAYDVKTDMMSSINASDLDQPPSHKMMVVSLCVESL